MDNEQLELNTQAEEVEDSQKAIEKLGRIAKEKNEVLSSVIAGSIDNIRQRVAFILNNYLPARNSDIKLAWMYWKTFEGHHYSGNCISEEEMLKLTKISSLTRIRAKIQNEYKLFQADEKVKKFRGLLDDDYRSSEIEDKPSYPVYSVHVDEAGKTQQYLSVGSLWIIDQKSAFFSFFELKKWVKDKSVEFEFHFVNLKHHRLNIYKEFFLKFLSLFPDASFKSIIVKNSGFKHLNNPITDLTFHLIHKGVEHENTSGRAKLPRLLNISIDNEDKGSDDLKLENLRERLSSQNLEGLYLNRFEAKDSKGDLFLQAVDLFTSSVNRKINNPDGSNHKDELASYILDLLDFRIDMKDVKDDISDNTKVFNLSYSLES